MDMLARLEASPLGQAARRLDFQDDGRLEEEPPDDQERPNIPATVAVGLEVPSTVSPSEQDSPAVAELRRDMNSVTSQLAQMNELMQLLLAQQQQRPQDAAEDSSAPLTPAPRSQQLTGSPTDDRNSTAQHSKIQ
jgi:hypothetical protein